MWALWETGDEVEGGEGEGGDVLGGGIWDGAGGEDGGPVGGRDGFHGLCVCFSEDARRLVDLTGESVGVSLFWGCYGDVVEFVCELTFVLRKRFCRGLARKGLIWR